MRQMRSTFPFSLVAAILIVGGMAWALGHYTRRPAALTGADADGIAVNLPPAAEDPVDLVPYMPTLCEVHQIEMKIDVVPIRYGELAAEPRLQQFPNGARWAPGGCRMLGDSPKSARIRICPECERGIPASNYYSDIDESEKRDKRR
jgi:hypothetical protein